MKSTGRLKLILTVLCTLIGWEVIHYLGDHYYFNLLENLIKILYIPLAWYLGLQFDKVKYSSNIDHLTGIYNRRSINEFFPKLEKQVIKNNRQLCIFLLDIDNFKVINDSQGHGMGDLVLKEISKILIENTRKTDYIARWGGDEFLVISSFTTEDFSDLFIKRMNEELHKLSNELNIEIEVSIGCSIYPIQTGSLDELINMADQKMYLAKKSNAREKKMNIYQHT